MKKIYVFTIMLTKRALYAIFLQCIFFQFATASALNGQNIDEVTITLKIENADLKEIFESIEDQTAFTFAFDKSILQTQKKHSLNYKEENLSLVLQDLGKTFNLHFRQISKTISVAPIRSGNKIFEQSGVFDEDINVTGTVTDQFSGEPLPGVNILLKGTTTGTVSDINGHYQLNVPDENSVLIFSFIGYETVEMPVNGRTTIDLTLVPDIESLQELVVVGYGTQKKSQVTGAISSVSESEIQSVPAISAGQALQGRAAGVDVISSNHQPGGGSTIRIRGINSINANNDPLFVLDGIPISGGINDISPSIIESMEVLKDASATAIYGARGANGVVLITTKRGNEGKTRITYDGYAGVSQILNKVDVLDAEGWVNYKKASRGTDDLTQILDPVELENYNVGRQVDWQDLILRDGLQQSHSIGVSGGNEKTQFFISGNYLEQKGIVVNSDYKRGSVQINIDHKVSDRLKLGTSTLLSTSKTSLVNTYRLLGQAMQISPLGNLHNEDGTLRMFPTSEALLGNPLLDANNEINQEYRTRIFASLYAEYEFLKGLKYRMNFGPDFAFGNDGQFIGSNTNTIQGGTNRASNAKEDTKAYTLENLLIFNRNFNEIHDLEITLLQSTQEQFFESNRVESEGIPSEKMLWHDLSAGQIRSFDTNQQKWSIISYMARINYSLMDKYLLTLTARRDGSSRFGEDKKFGFFPSVALGWRVVEEKFMQNVPLFSDLKLRVSYGSIGNTAIDPYQSQGNLSKASYMFGSTPALGFEPNTLPNPDLQWETSTTANMGLDFGVLGNRITGTFEYYQINTRDLLLNQRLPRLTGYESILTNIGKTRNTGYELTLSTINFDIPDGFRWTTNFNFAINKNQIVELYGEGDDEGNNWFIGEPINVYYDMVFDGIWQEDERDLAASYDRLPGQIKVKDLNNDKQITAKDRQILGSSTPKWSGGITNKFSYKGIDLSVFINTRQDFLINSELHTIDNLAGRFNIPTFVNYYTPENPSNDYPMPVKAGQNINLHVLKYRDGSFVRVRNINLGYNLPEKLLSKTGIGTLRVYVNAQNPFTFTDFEGWDPESGAGLSSYPSTKMFLVGLNASF